ncbi:hypothetical protein [Pengzhenrongella sp.]|jgi:phosphoribosylformimino-5-aminoimidazole carboxamide ribonucleotide (ProFAR) isomerase|uniref:hypothetical protein n=1 Tax=Pengzhenrongella sp. TaxID=2888820 RepID=UPI002F948450
MGEHTMWDRDGLRVWAEWGKDGKLTIQGQDLRAGPRGNAEYEYAISIAVDDVSKVLEALGGASDDDVLELLCAHGATIVSCGPKQWVEDLGVRPELWSWFDPDEIFGGP